MILISANKGKEINYDKAIEDSKQVKQRFKYRFLTQVSTPLYAAPEIINHSLYTESVDIWGAGIILYLMIFGDIPLEPNENSLYYHIN